MEREERENEGEDDWEGEREAPSIMCTIYKCPGLTYSLQPHFLFCTQMTQPFLYFSQIFLKLFYLFIFRERERRERGIETSVCGCLLCSPCWGPGPEPRHVP